MKTRFRIKSSDTIKSRLTINGKLVSIVYDSGFTTINEVLNTLNNKISDYDRRKGVYHYSILNETKDEYKSIEKVK